MSLSSLSSSDVTSKLSVLTQIRCCSIKDEQWYAHSGFSWRFDVCFKWTLVYHYRFELVWNYQKGKRQLWWVETFDLAVWIVRFTLETDTVSWVDFYVDLTLIWISFHVLTVCEVMLRNIFGTPYVIIKTQYRINYFSQVILSTYIIILYVHLQYSRIGT